MRKAELVLLTCQENVILLNISYYMCCDNSIFVLFRES